MSRALAADASLAEMVRGLERELRRCKQTVRDQRQAMRLIRSRLASARAECDRRGIRLSDTR